MYHNFANLFYKLSESNFLQVNKQVLVKSKSNKSIYLISCYARDSLPLLRTPVSAIFVLAPRIDNAAIVLLHCILGKCLPIYHALTSRRAHDKTNLYF